MVYIPNLRVALVIGEMKQNLINSQKWQSGHLTNLQNKLRLELRGLGGRTSGEEHSRHLEYLANLYYLMGRRFCHWMLSEARQIQPTKVEYKKK